jgi:hypothetical protein
MSLYGPRLNLPKIDLPSASNPSWNLDKEKKLIIGIVALIIILIIVALIGPSILSTISEISINSFNPAVGVVWRNNPLNITQGIKSAELDLILTNNTKSPLKETLFNITTDSEEIIIFCPNSLYDTNKSAYLVENLAPNDIRKIPCIIRRNSTASVFSGTYSIKVNTTLGNIVTNFEIITK